MVPNYQYADTVEDLLAQNGLNGDTVVNVNGTMKYDNELKTGDTVMFSAGAVKSA
jgi:sulfur carrier protein ThiS